MTESPSSGFEAFVESCAAWRDKLLLLFGGAILIALAAVWLAFDTNLFLSSLRLSPLLAASSALPVGMGILGVLLFHCSLTGRWPLMLAPRPLTAGAFFREVGKGVVTGLGILLFLTFLSPPFPFFDSTWGTSYNPPAALFLGIVFLGLRFFRRGHHLPA